MDTEPLLIFGGVVLVAVIIIAVLLLRQSKSGGGSQRAGGRTGGARGGTRAGGGRSSGRSRATSSAGTAAGPQAQQNVKNNWIVGRSGNVQGKAFHIGERMASIGRGVANYIQVDDETSSQRHALLIGTPNTMQISDMNSSNGTFVNGRKLGSNEEYTLQNGDEIKLGDTVFIYQRSGAYEDAALAQQKKVDDTEQTKAAMSVSDLLGGGQQDLEKQVLVAIQTNNGDYQAAAQQLGLDVDILEQIVEKAQIKYKG